MKDIHDKLTGDLITKRGPGRPSTGKAMTPAQKQKAYRERKKSLGNAENNKSNHGSVAVMLNDEERTAIIVMLQDKAKHMSFMVMKDGPLKEEKLKSAKWISELASKIAHCETKSLFSQQ